MSGRTPYGQVFAEPDGSFTTEETVVPTRVRQGASWVPVDTTLVATAGGGWGPKAALVDVTVSNGGSGPFITYRAGDKSGNTLTLSWAGSKSPLPVPVISGSTARYPSVLPGVDLWVIVTATGFRPVLEVTKPVAGLPPVSYQVGGTLHGVSMPDGRVRLADSDGNTVLVTDPAVMWDSTVDPLKGNEGGSGEALVSTAEQAGDTAQIGQLETITSGSDLTVREAKSFVGPPVYPVFIDPGISISPSQNKWAYSDSANANNTTDKARVGKDPTDGTLYRSFFNFPTSQGSLTWRGKKILSAEFDIELWHSYACSDSEDDWTFAYYVATITTTSSRMPWSGSGSRWLPGTAGVGAQGHANKAGGCGAAQPDFLMSFGGDVLKNQVQHVANENFSTYAIGLCACNAQGENETSQYRWKKFYIDSRAKLIVKYDTVPGTPANLTAAGAACGSTIGTTSPTLSAQMVDADSGDTLSAAFKYQQLPSGTVTTVTHTGIPANNFNTLPLSGLVEGATYQWQVQTTDAAGYPSAATAWCSFTIAAAPPPFPSVTATGSPSYSACDPASIDSCPHAGGPGVPGSFTLSPNGAANVTSFTYGWSSPPTTTVTVAAGVSVTIKVTPPHFGLNTLYVSDSNGVKKSGIVPYRFLVGAPSGPVASWPLDDVLGGFTDQISGGTMTVNSGVSLTADAHYIGASSATFNGDSGSGYATQAVPALDTSNSFSVGAWVRPTSLQPGNRTAVAQDAGGTGDNSAFYLGIRFDGSTPYWSFMMEDTSSSAGAEQAIFSSALDSSVVGKWVYLVGVFDAAQKTMSLDVNGVLVATATRTVTPWRATGPVTVGHARWNGGGSDGFAGNIADVQVWNRVVTADDIAGTDAAPATGVAARTGLMAPLQVGSWDFNDTDPDCGCINHARDGGLFARPMYLDPGWTNDPPDSAFTLDSEDAEGGLWTDGKSGYASTTNPADAVARPVVRTDQSFTVSAWVNLVDTSTYHVAVVFPGAYSSSFFLYYDAVADRWGFASRSSDAVGAGGAYALSTSVPDTDTWTHLVGVYDAVAGLMDLYVNGSLEASVAYSAGWEATGSVQLGRFLQDDTWQSYWAGEIDEVQLWQGALSAREVADLHNA